MGEYILALFKICHILGPWHGNEWQILSFTSITYFPRVRKSGAPELSRNAAAYPLL